jgi:hypothetical protein
MSLLHTARINGHEPHAYLKDVLERLPTHPANRIEELNRSGFGGGSNS